MPEHQKLIDTAAWRGVRLRMETSSLARDDSFFEAVLARAAAVPAQRHLVQHNLLYGLT